jgi:hypothetical protein
VPLFKGSWVPDLIAYVPSLTEWMVTLTGFALVVTLYSFGRAWLFGGRDAEASKTMPELPAADPQASQIDNPQLLRAAAEHGVSAEAMQFIVAQMQAQGLGTEHLLTQSLHSPWQRMTPPTVGATRKRQPQP